MYTFPFVPFRYSKTLTVGIIILVLCLLPSSEFSSIKMPITFTDVIIHFLMFLGFSSALYLDITKKKTDYRIISVLIAVFVISMGLGALTEMLQFLITPLKRSASFGDFLSDIGGSVIGASLGIVIRRIFSVAP